MVPKWRVREVKFGVSQTNQILQIIVYTAIEEFLPPKKVKIERERNRLKQ